MITRTLLSAGLRALFLLTMVSACNPFGTGPVPPDQRTSPPTQPQETRVTETLSPEDAADLILYNGTVLTMEAGVVATAIAIKGDEIMTIGNDKRLRMLAGPDTGLVDLEGLTLMPGFVDPHNHAFTSLDGDHLKAQNLALANGITSLAGFFDKGEVMEEIQGLDEAGDLHMRVHLYPIHVTNCGDVLGSWYVDEFPVSQEPGARLHVTGVKLFNDGGSCNVPAVSYEYPGGIGNGDLYFSAEELAAILHEVQSNGYQAAIHSLGDRAVEATQDAIEMAINGGPNVFRHRIEHNTVLREDLIPRYSALDIVPTIFGAFPSCFWAGDTSRFKFVTPPEHRDKEWAWRPLVDGNPDVHFAWHTDYPIFTIDPFDILYGFVTRREVAEDGSICEPPDWAADDTLSVDEALPMMTIDAAYAIFREDELGSLKIGKLADLIIVSGNPLDVEPDALPDLELLMTMVGGQVEYCAAEAEEYCP